MKKFTVGLIGFGYWGKILLKYLTNNEGFRLKSIAVRNPKKIESAVPAGVKLCTVGEIASDSEIDAVFIATPIKSHFELVKLFLKHGKHIFCEKPLTEKYSEALELKNLAENSGLTLFTDYIYTFSPSLKKMTELALSGEIGTIRSVVFNIRQLGHFSENNVYMDLGCHCLALLDTIAPLHLSENPAQKIPGKWVFSRRDIMSGDNITETGEIDFELIETKDESIKGSMFLSFNHPWKNRNITIYGNKGSITYDMIKDPPLQMEKYSVNRMISRDPEKRQASGFNFDESNNIAFTVEHFHKILTGEAESNTEQAVRVTRILEKILG
ncbi:MAG: Gfo/Idh/MocA family oxidoreductase [Firmicutes bacterium]|nr:Gfo/Idh/MocA family oxidoreductase [Bacillota bacterium]